MNNNLVYRAKDTFAQSQLGASKRKGNLKRAFKLRETTAEKYVEHIAIVDDVVTTMATVSAISRLLKSIGIARVDIWAIARATLHQ